MNGISEFIKAILKCKTKTFEVTRGNRENISRSRHVKNFLNRTPVAQGIRERIDKWDCIKLKTFCSAKEIINSKEAAYGMEENLCQTFI
jgi:hypothetical protein